MYNHFRTTLLNLARVDDSDFIPQAFTPRKLTGVFKEVHTKLFPPGTSRAGKFALADAYISLIKAAGLESVLTTFDDRIIESPVTPNFKINRISQAVTSDYHYPLFVSGSYIPSAYGNTDRIVVKQVPGLNKITVFSTTYGAYLTETGKVLNIEDAEIDILEGISFVDAGDDNLLAGDEFIYAGAASEGAPTNVTADIFLPTIGVKIRFGLPGATLTATADKSWEFKIETFYQLDLVALYNDLKNSTATERVLTYSSAIDTSSYDAMWKLHFNLAYRLAAYIVLYVLRLNKL